MTTPKRPPAYPWQRWQFTPTDYIGPPIAAIYDRVQQQLYALRCWLPKHKDVRA